MMTVRTFVCCDGCGRPADCKHSLGHLEWLCELCWNVRFPHITWNAWENRHPAREATW